MDSKILDSRHYFLRDREAPFSSLEIQNLAQKVLDPKSFLELLERISFYSSACLNESIASDEQTVLFTLDAQRYVINEVIKYIGIQPKRPLFYLVNCVSKLPADTRNAVKYAGDYLDQLLKHFFSKNTVEFSKTNTKSLGANLGNKLIKDKIPADILKLIEDFNNILYVPAKHQFEYTTEHLFTPQEAIMACYITIELSKKICEISTDAKLYALEEDKNYYFTANE